MSAAARGRARNGDDLVERLRRPCLGEVQPLYPDRVLAETHLENKGVPGSASKEQVRSRSSDDS